MKCLSKYYRNNFIILSVIIALIDVLFVVTGIASSKQSLSNSIENQASQVAQSYQALVEQASTNMSLLATYIASDSRLKEFIEDKDIYSKSRSLVKKSDDSLNDDLRSHLFTLQDLTTWQAIQQEYAISTFQLVLASNLSMTKMTGKSLSSEDSLKGARNTVVKALESAKVQKGYAFGKTMAELTAVAPVFGSAEDELSRQNDALKEDHVVAVVDVGIMLNHLLEKLEKNMELGSGIVFYDSTFAQEMGRELSDNEPKLDYIESCSCFVQYQSEPILSNLMSELRDDSFVNTELKNSVVHYAGKPFNVVSIPLLSSASPSKVDDSTKVTVSTNVNEKHLGKVVLWKDASPIYAQHSQTIQQVVTLGVIGYILAELIILWAFVSSMKSLDVVIREATEELEESQGNLIQAQRIANTGSWSFNQETDSLHWSEQIYHIFELEKEKNSPSYQLFLDVIHPEDRDKVDQVFRESLKNRAPFYVNHRLVMPDGRIKHVIEEGKTIFSPKIKADITIGAVRDITDSYVAQQKEKLAASVLKYTNEGIFISNEKLDIIDVNKACLRISGIEPDKYKKFNLLRYKSHFLNPEQFDKMINGLQDEEHWNDEIWIKLPSGEEVALDLNISSVRNDHGRLTHYVGIFSDITLKKRHEERLNYIAHFDSLTGLPNRILFTDRLSQAILQTERSQKHIAILFLDLDGFKKINDNYGHQVGDMMLEHVANQFKQCIRAGDTVARFGGDEFVFVIRNVATPCAYDIPISRILDAVSAPMVHEGSLLHVSASIGISFYPKPDSKVGAEALLKQADTAMYEAKSAGKNGFKIYDEECKQEA